jgi:hypothetical protein
MRTSAYGVHADYIFGGLAAKRNRLREAQLWLDDPYYYSLPRLLQVRLPSSRMLPDQPRIGLISS